MNAIIDIGNTRAKLALFNRRDLIELNTFELQELPTALEKRKNEIKNAIISNVNQDIDLEVKNILNKSQFLPLNTSKLNIAYNHYKEKELGLDRKANAAKAVIHFKGENTLVIDAGSCITYDLVNKQGEFLSGGISPGYLFRLKAMHQFTARLPQIDNNETWDIQHWAIDTKSSMLRSCLQGIVAEITDQINYFLEQFPDGNIVLTGGDCEKLQKLIKKPIFANQNWTLEGLNEILLSQI